MPELILESLSKSKFRLHAGEGMLTFRQLIRLLAEDAPFRSRWTQALADLPFQACRWECPRLDNRSAELPFECVVSDHPALAQTSPEPTDFAEHFNAATGAAVVDFPNLGGDAHLVVPCPGDQPHPDHAHLLSFLRTASESRVHALWKRLGEIVLERIGTDPLWINTAGMGVYWLHVRLDQRPKYYEHAAYQQA